MEEQWGDEKRGRFSYTKVDVPTEQRCCWITYTNAEVHEVLKTGFEKSPMFTGRIKGLGPRYCPSIEDKINRFAERERHQIFVEPEGFRTVEIYVNGFSTSLPEDVQLKALQLIPSQFIYEDGTVYEKVLGVLDFVSGMTDNFATDLYRKIKGIDIGMTM